MRQLLFLLLATWLPCIQENASKSEAVQLQVPSYPNISCPIMGKPISSKLYTDVSYGRIWICCKGCAEEIQADVELAYRTAYPTTKRLENERCPLSEAAILPDSPRVELQGFDFAVASLKEVELAKAESQITLARLHNPKLKDLGNNKCPVLGTAVDCNAFIVIDGTIVRLSSSKVLEDVRKDPRKILEKARLLRQEESKKEPNKESRGGLGQ